MTTAEAAAHTGGGRAVVKINPGAYDRTASFSNLSRPELPEMGSMPLETWVEARVWPSQRVRRFSVATFDNPAVIAQLRPGRNLGPERFVASEMRLDSDMIVRYKSIEDRY